ncbi:MAG: hypothetical protein J6X40_02620 [Bacteroidales bacterium]|nr:hypothetical protein [Bacteroidales bacterium]
MNTFLTVVLVLIALLLAVAVFITYRSYRLREWELRLKSKGEMRVATMKMVTPLKIQACERLLLFLERSQLPALVKRVYAPGLSKEQFHLALLRSVEEEYEHNIAQQLYVSSEAWDAVQRAKEELVGQVNATFDKAETDTDVALVAQALVALPNPFVEQAIALLKKEFNEI